MRRRRRDESVSLFFVCCCCCRTSSASTSPSLSSTTLPRFNHPPARPPYGGNFPVANASKESSTTQNTLDFVVGKCSFAAALRATASAPVTVSSCFRSDSQSTHLMLSRSKYPFSDFFVILDHGRAEATRAIGGGTGGAAT